MKLKRPELEVLVRNASNATAEQTAQAIYNLLNLKVNSVIGNTHFKRIEAIAEPFFVSQSKSNLFIYSINFSLEISGA